MNLESPSRRKRDGLSLVFPPCYSDIVIRLSSGDKFIWTNHSHDKMRYYRLTESRIKRVIRHPVRTEEGIFEGAIAVMSPAGGRTYSEIWALYVLFKIKGEKKIKIITAWRYPGRSPARDPIPPEVLREIRSIL